jgi:DNA primase
MPLTWRQVGARLDPARFTIETAPRALAKSGDPFAGVLGAGIDPVALLGELGERLAER